MSKLSLQRGKFWKQFGFENLEADEYKKRTTAVELGFLSAVGGVGYTLLYIYFGFSSLTIAVIAYVVTFFVNLFILRITKNYTFFKTSQLLACTFLPVLAQLLIGGFIEGSAVALSAFLSPAGALLFSSRHVARRYFYMFLVLIIGIGFYEYYYITPVITLPRKIIITFFVIVITTTFSIIYFILESFLKKLEEVRNELKKSLIDLKATQSQLIQSEKMASLGELTAGIAHEIQNPLNFVNNFSEVNTDLVDELLEELNNNNSNEVKELAAMIKENNVRIVQHGKRADGIVKGMLLHSRKTSGQKELTDMNVLCTEYLQLSYHGIRTKNKSFSATLETQFDSSLQLINIVAADIGRVLLNVFNNAFYAMDEKKKLGVEPFQPTLILQTKAIPGGVEIRVKDNGNGIPASVIDKIYQPFFTTKPTGEGTGLGLSLSYDIITKQHGGAIEVSSEPGNYTQFIITLTA